MMARLVPTLCFAFAALTGCSNAAPTAASSTASSTAPVSSAPKKTTSGAPTPSASAATPPAGNLAIPDSSKWKVVAVADLAIEFKVPPSWAQETKSVNPAINGITGEKGTIFKVETSAGFTVIVGTAQGDSSPAKIKAKLAAEESATKIIYEAEDALVTERTNFEEKTVYEVFACKKAGDALICKAGGSASDNDGKPADAFTKEDCASLIALVRSIRLLEDQAPPSSSAAPDASE